MFISARKLFEDAFDELDGAQQGGIVDYLFGVGYQ
jgi:hypothetical protein